MTKARGAVLAVLDASDEPIAAADIRKVLGDGTDIATIYRTLRWLVDNSRAEEFAFACEKRGVERYYVSKAHPHRHFFHCEGCHRFLPVDGCFAEEMGRKLEAERGFLVAGHALYFTGLCPDCAARTRSAGDRAATDAS